MRLTRHIVAELAHACRHPIPLIQVIVWPRRVGKTTATEQLVRRLRWSAVVADADAPFATAPLPQKLTA